MICHPCRGGTHEDCPELARQARLEGIVLAGSQLCECRHRVPYKTKTGRLLTDADVDALAVEAERGYDVSGLAGKAVTS